MGAIFFAASLVALLAFYPRHLRFSKWVALGAFACWLVVWLGFVMETFANISIVYLMMLVLFASSFVLAFIQWRQTAQMPVERAALKWYLLSIYLGTGLFATLILIPVAAGVEPSASQGLMFMVFLFMFIGIAMGITRYRLFDLGRWWFAAWSWFLGGLLVIVMDLILLSVVGLGQAISLAFSLALIGWLYFPTRQWLFERLLQKKKLSRYGQTGRLVESLFSVEEPEQLSLHWRQYLQDEWHPLSIELKPGHIHMPFIDQYSQCLNIPYLDNKHHLQLSYPDGGSRLFSRDDFESVTFLYELAQQAAKGLKMRLQALEEKRGILGDLHDDVGSKLLSLLHRSEDPVNNELARNALRDLREVVSQPDQDNWRLVDKLSDWRIEAVERLKDAGITLHWRQSECGLQEVSYFTASHLARVLREALNNIIKHAQATSVKVAIEISGDQLILQVKDNGHGKSPENWRSGRGVSNIRHRVEKLQGQVNWQQNTEGGILLKVTIPLPENPNDS
ncbi:ATP-binding protein [Thiomicrorhabdus sp.]|uniref:ATP-binding protein n=1 Tax=Thiomicrorhabdus sp. TaxID=2039724 RepID=UPI0029C86654|nr:ATP-binding protein [Thiomicrorhabdus sp.]